MAHSRDRGNKEKRRPPKQDKQGKKGKGVPPHLQRTNDSSKSHNGSLREIQRHINELEEKQK